MAGRTVGSIEVTVDADTGRLKATLVKGGEVAGRAGGKAAGDSFEKAMAESFDGREFLLKLKKLQQEAQRALSALDVDIDIDPAKAKADVRRLKEELRAIDLQLEVQADLDTGDLQARVRLLRAELQKIDLSVGATLDKKQVLAIKAEANELLGDIDIEVSTDRSNFDSVKDKLVGFFTEAGEEAGSSSGSSFGRSFLRFLPNQVADIVQFVVPLMEQVGAGLQGALAGAIAVVSSAFNALAGAAGAALPILAGIGAVAGSIVIGMQGMGGAIKAVTKEFDAAVAEGRAFNFQAEGIQKALKGLAPEAAGVVQVFADLLPQLKGLQKAIQGELFKGMGAALRELGTTLIPDVGASLMLAAQSANTFGKNLAGALEGIDFSKLFVGIKPAVDDILASIVSLVRAFGPFLNAAAPAARELAAWLKVGADHLADLVSSGAKSGAITDFLKGGIDSLKTWADLVGNVGKALFTLFQAGKTEGDGLVQSLSNIVGRFNDWMRSVQGQTALRDFFATGKQFAADLVPVFRGLQGAIETLVTPVAAQRFGELAKNIGDVLPVLGELMSALSNTNIIGIVADAIAHLADEIAPLIPKLAEFASGFGQGLSAGINGVVTALGPVVDMLGKLLDIITPIAPAIGIAVAAFLTLKAVVTVIEAIKTAIQGLEVSTGIFGLLALGIGLVVQAFTDFGGSEKEVIFKTDDLAQSLEDTVTSMLKSGEAAKTAALGVDALNRSITSSSDGGKELSEAMGTLGFSIDDTLDLMVRLGKDGRDVDEAFSNIGKATGLTDEAVQGLIGTFKNMKDPMASFTDDTQLTSWAKAWGVSKEALLAAAKAMDTVIDSAQGMDLDATIRQFLSLSAATSDVNQQLLQQAEAQTGVNRTGTDLLGLYKDYTSRLDANAEASANVDAAAQQQRAAIDAAATSASNASGAYSGLDNTLGTTASKLTETAQAATDAQKAAKALADQIDLLNKPALDQQAAMDAVTTSILELQDGYNQAKEKADGYTLSLDGTTKASIDQRDRIREAVGAIETYASTALATGQSVDQTNNELKFMTESLINQVSAFTGSRDSAIAYLQQLGLLDATGEISTSITQPGMDQALTNTDILATNVAEMPPLAEITVSTPGLPQAVDDTKALTTETDKLPDSTTTDVSQPGMDGALSDTDALGTKIDDLPEDVKVNVTIPDIDTLTTKTQTLKDKFTALPTTVSIPISQPGMDTALSNTQSLRDKLDGLHSVTMFFSTPGMTEALSNTRILNDRINAMDGRTITIHVRQDGQTTFAEGGIVGPMGGIGGEAGPEIATYGGVSRLINQPTSLPPGTVVTPLTGGSIGNSGQVIQKQVNNFVTVETATADPEAVAVGVVNRVAAVAASL